MGCDEIWGLDPDQCRPKLGTTIWSAGRKPPGICGVSNLWYAQNTYPKDILKTAQVWQTKKKNQVSTTAVLQFLRENECACVVVESQNDISWLLLRETKQPVSSGLCPASWSLINLTMETSGPPCFDDEYQERHVPSTKQGAEKLDGLWILISHGLSETAWKLEKLKTKGHVFNTMNILTWITYYIKNVFWLETWSNDHHKSDMLKIHSTSSSLHWDKM